jgi:hypothetical protein
MKNKIKLIVTVRDVSSANDLSCILPCLINHDQFNVRVFAQEPAYTILKNILNSDISVDFIGSVDDLGHEIIENLVNKVFLSFKPDCILTGISGPDYGIDEIALGVCSSYDSINTFSIQSYWGDLNNACGSIADTIFVLDDFASELTKERHAACNTVITGSWKSNLYNQIDITKERSKFKLHNFNNNSGRLVALFGQPLFEYEWYRDTLELFIKFASEINPPLEIIYKPHPKEKGESISWTINKLSNSSIEFSTQERINTLKLLAVTDMAVSLFSTVGYDLQNLLQKSEIPFSLPMYLFFNKDFKRWYFDNCRLSKIPLSDKEMSIVVENSNHLKQNIENALSFSTKERCYSAILKHFKQSEVDSIEDLIISEILSTRL